MCVSNVFSQNDTMWNNVDTHCLWPSDLGLTPFKPSCSFEPQFAPEQKCKKYPLCNGQNTTLIAPIKSREKMDPKRWRHTVICLLNEGAKGIQDALTSKEICFESQQVWFLGGVHKQMGGTTAYQQRMNVKMFNKQLTWNGPNHSPHSHVVNWWLSV